MKKLLFSFMITAMVSASAFAQEQPAQPVSQEQKDYKKERAYWEKKLKDELKLTDEQAARFEALNKDFNEKMDALKTDATSDKDAFKEKKMALKKERETKLFEILTPEQQAKYKEIIEKKNKEHAAKSGS